MQTTPAGQVIPFTPPSRWRVPQDGGTSASEAQRKRLPFAPDASTWLRMTRGSDTHLAVHLLSLGEDGKTGVQNRALLTTEAPSEHRELRLIPTVRVPSALLVETASSRLGRPVESLRLHPWIDLERPEGRAFARLVRFVAAERRRSDGFHPSGQPMDQLARALVDALLDLQPFEVGPGERPPITKAPSPASATARHGLDEGPGEGPKIIRRVERLIQRRLGEDLTVGDLATHAGVSARTLFRNYRRYRGRSPLQSVREARLERVRADLEAARAGENVTLVATRWGFSHLGRFSEIYRRAYGEHPSETLRRKR